MGLLQAGQGERARDEEPGRGRGRGWRLYRMERTAIVLRRAKLISGQGGRRILVLDFSKEYKERE